MCSLLGTAVSERDFLISDSPAHDEGWCCSHSEAVTSDIPPRVALFQVHSAAKYLSVRFEVF